jgi:hypothetical protein
VRSLQEREQELRAAAEKLLKVLRDTDTDAFLALVHENYFGVGESGDLTRQELKQAFERRVGMYCYLFDSSCIPNQSLVESGRFVAFAELARRPGARVDKVEVWATEGIEEPGCGGHANLKWVANEGEELLINVSRFTFLRVRGKWKTVGFDDLVYSRPETKAPQVTK